MASLSADRKHGHARARMQAARPRSASKPRDAHGTPDDSSIVGRTLPRWLGILCVTVWLSGLLTTEVRAIAPNSPDATLLAMSPETNLIAIHWFGFKSPDSASENRTEQLFANEEMQQLGEAIDQLIDDLIEKASQSPGSPPAELLQQVYLRAKQAASHPGLVYLSQIEVKPDESLGYIDAGLVLQLGELADAFETDLEQLAASAPAEARTQVEIAGQSCTQIQTPEKEVVITWTAKDGYLLITIGRDAMQKLLARQSATKMPAWVEASMKRVPIDRRWFLMHADFDAMRKLSLPPIPPQPAQLLTALGLSQVKSLDVSSGLHSTSSGSHSSLQLASFAGIFSLADSKPLTAADLAGIPQNSLLAGAARFDALRLYRLVDSIVRTLGEEPTQNWEQVLTALRDQTGLDLETDLLAALGDTWTIYQTGTAMGVLPTVVASVSVRDKDRLIQTHDAILQIAERALATTARDGNPPPTIAKAEIQGQPAYYLKGIPVAVAWQINDTHLTVATSIQILRAHQHRQRGPKSLADHPAIQPLLEKSPGPIAFTFNDAPRTMEGLFQALPMILSAATGELRRQGIDVDTTAIPAWDTVQPFFEPSVVTMTRTSDSIDIQSQETLPISSMGGLTAPVMVALLLPAISAARAAARRSQSINNTRQLNLALLNFEAAMGRFPSAAIPTKDGKPGLSWRVALLPFLEEQALYEQFHLDEPWDSDHNKTLIEAMPEVYLSPTSANPKGKTNYLAVRGENALIVERDNKLGRRIREILDGTSKTIWLVEVNDEQAVEWTRPDDFTPDPQQPTNGLLGMHPSGFIAGFVDGSTKFLPLSISAETLKAYFTINGGEAIP